MNNYFNARDNLWTMIETVNDSTNITLIKQLWEYMFDEQQWHGNNLPSRRFGRGTNDEVIQRVYDILNELMTQNGSTDHEDLIYAMCKNSEHCLYNYTMNALAAYRASLTTDSSDDSNSDNSDNSSNSDN
jgi:hypothetical protein